MHCVRCGAWFTVPLSRFRAGAVFRCPTCLASLVPTLPLVTAVRQAIAELEATIQTAREREPERGAEEQAAAEEEATRARAAMEVRLRELVAREPLAGAMRPRRSALAL